MTCIKLYQNGKGNGGRFGVTTKTKNMRELKLLLFFITISVFVNAQQKNLYQINFSGKELMILNTKGKTTCALTYSDVNSLYKSFKTFAVVKKNNKWGVVNPMGKELIPFIYDSLSSFYNEQNNSASGNYQKNDLYDLKGYFYFKNNAKIGCIDSKGMVLIENKFDDLAYYYNKQYVIAINNTRWYIVNTKNKFEIPLSKKIKYNNEGDYILIDSLNKVGVIDANGKTIIPFIYDNYNVYDYTIYKKGNKFGRIDPLGNIILPFKYDSILPTKKLNHYFTLENNSWTYIDNSNGVNQIGTVFEDVIKSEYSESLNFAAKKNNEWAIYDQNANLLYKINCDVNSLMYNSDFFIYTKNKKPEVINVNGASVIPAMYDSIIVSDLDNCSSKYGRVRVFRNGKCGIFSIKFQKEVVECKYDELCENVEMPDNAIDDLVCVNSQIGSTKYNYYKICFNNNNMKPVEGTNIVNDYLMMSNHETTIREWLWYMYEDENYMSGSFPDTNLINPICKVAFNYFQTLNYCEDNGLEFPSSNYDYINVSVPFSARKHKVYFPKSKEKEFLNAIEYPITGITYQQTQLFCDMINNLDNNGSKLSKDKKYKQFYKLPTEKEWELTAKVGLNKGMIDVKDSVNAEGCLLFRYSTSNNCESTLKMLNTRGKYSVMSYDFYPDNNGIYNLFGNVAEMVEEEGISKGGSYNDFAKKCHSKEVIEYTGPKAWLGFRYCVVWEYEFNF